MLNRSFQRNNKAAVSVTSVSGIYLLATDYLQLHVQPGALLQALVASSIAAVQMP
jgi:hypothetical protein